MKNSGFFFFKSNENFRTISLQRLSFFLYSCERDTFQSKLKVIISHVKELYVELKDIPHLEYQALLIIRVLFIRFSHENLYEIIRQLWPMIYADIINRLKNNKNIDVIYSIMKFIEFLSVVNTEYFSIFQWALIQDTTDINKLVLNNNILDGNSSNMFKPFSMCIFKKDYDYYLVFKNLLEENNNNHNVYTKSLVLREPKVNIFIILY